MAVGAVVGVVVGYLMYTAGGGDLSFGYWSDHLVRYGGLWWALIGAAIGAALVYINRLTGY